MNNLNVKENRSWPELYWMIIGALLVGVSALFIIHLVTGFTPDGVAFLIPVIELPVFWYGIWIMGGVGLGAYVISRLAYERALAQFNRDVPSELRKRPLTDLSLPEKAERILTKGRVKNLGDLLLPWGFDPRNLGLNKAGIAEVRTKLLAHPDVADEWVLDAPWRKWNPDHVWNGVVYCLILGVIGARLYHVLTPSPSMAAVGIYSPMDYFRNPFQLINLRNGGLGIYGGLAGGMLGILIYTRRQRIPTVGWMDLTVIGVSLGQVFGRWGNFFNQELYGRPTDLPWAITIDPVHRLPDYASFTRFHPAFLYESLWNLLTFLTLHFLLKRWGKRLLTGELTAVYLIFYAIGRILLETVRLDSRPVTIGSLQLNMAIATLVSIIVALGMVVWIVIRRKMSN